MRWSLCSLRLLRSTLPWLATLLWLIACIVIPMGLSAYGGDSSSSSELPTSFTAVIGPVGGTLIGPDGVQVLR